MIVIGRRDFGEGLQRAGGPRSGRRPPNMMLNPGIRSERRSSARQSWIRIPWWYGKGATFEWGVVARWREGSRANVVSIFHPTRDDRVDKGGSTRSRFKIGGCRVRTQSFGVA